MNVSVGQTTASFTIAAQPVSAQITPSIGASCGGGTATAVLTINPPALTSLQLFPNPVAGGQSAAGTVTLSGPAPAGGFPVTLTKGADPGSIVGLPSPASVTVAPGQTKANFILTTTSTAAPASVAINGCVSGTTPAATATLVVNPAVAISIACGQTVSGSLSASDITSTNPAFAGSGTYYAKRYTFTPSVSGNYILTPTASGFDPVVSLISPAGYLAGPPTAGQAVFALTAGTAYAFEISTGSAGQTGSFQLHLGCPQASGPAVLSVKNNGTAVPNDPNLTGTAVSFGTTPQGVLLSQTFTLVNTGGTDLAINSVALSGDYKIVGAVPSLVPAGGQATLTLQFNATSQGAAPGTVLIANDSAVSPYQFRITATATAPGSLPSVVSVTPSSPAVTGGLPQTETVTLSSAAPPVA